MSMDPIADFLVALKNASKVSHESVVMPYSKVKHALSRTLHESGYIAGFEKAKREGKDVIKVTLAYRDGTPRITDVARVSKPSRRVYVGVRDIRPVKFGHGLLVLSTPKGILTSDQALKERVGGEAVCKLW
jgi:small subunit ribosomal protein S8